MATTTGGASFTQNLELKMSVDLSNVSAAFDKVQRQVQSIMQRVENARNKATTIPTKMQPQMDETQILRQAEKTRKKVSQIYEKIKPSTSTQTDAPKNTIASQTEQVKKLANNLNILRKPLAIPVQIATAPFKALQWIAANAFSTIKNAGIGTFAAIGFALYKFHQKFDATLKTFYEFDKQMGLIWTISDFGGEIKSQKNKLDAFSKDVQKIAVDTAGKLPEIARAAYWTISAGAQERYGVSKKEALEITRTGSKLSTAAAASPDVVIPSLALMVNSLGEQLGKTITEQYERAADIVFSMQEMGVITVQDVAQYQGKVLGLSAAAGVNPEDAAAFITSLTRTMQPAEAYTSYSSLLSQIANPSEEGKAYAESKGIDFGIDAVKAVGFNSFLQNLYNKIGGDIEGQAKLLGNIRAIRGTANIFSKENWGAYQIVQRDFTSNKIAGAAERAHEKVRLTQEFRQEQADTKHDIVRTTLGKAISPKWIEMQKTGYNVMDYASLQIGKQFASAEELPNILKASNDLMAEMGEGTKAWANLLADVGKILLAIGQATVAIVEPLIPAFTLAGKIVGEILTSFVDGTRLIREDLSGIVNLGGLRQFLDFLKSEFPNVSQKISNALNQTWVFFQSIWRKISPMFVSVWEKITPIIQDIWTIGKNIFGFIGDILTKIVSLEEQFGLISNTIKIIGNVLAIPLNIIGAILNGIVRATTLVVEWEQKVGVIRAVFGALGDTLSIIIFSAEKITSTFVSLAKSLGLVSDAREKLQKLEENPELIEKLRGKKSESNGDKDFYSVDARHQRSVAELNRRIDTMQKIKKELRERMFAGNKKEEIEKALIVEIKFPEREVKKALDQYEESLSEIKQNVRKQIETGTPNETIVKTMTIDLGYPKDHVAVAMRQIQEDADKQIAIIKQSTEAVEKIKEAAIKKQAEIDRAAAFAKEQSEKKNLSNLEDYMKKGFQRQTNLLKKEMDVHTEIIRKAKDKQEDIVKDLADSKMSFVERRAKIISAGLNPGGKRIQQRGLADYYKQKAADALANKDFDKAIKLSEKAQDIFGTLAEDQENQSARYDLKLFENMQTDIENIFQQQKEANEKIITDSADKIVSLQGNFLSLFENLKEELTIKVSTEDAKAKLQDLQEKLVEIMKISAGQSNLASSQEDAKEIFKRRANYSQETLAKIQGLSGIKSTVDDWEYATRQDIFNQSSARQVQSEFANWKNGMMPNLSSQDSKQFSSFSDWLDRQKAKAGQAIVSVPASKRLAEETITNLPDPQNQTESGIRRVSNRTPEEKERRRQFLQETAKAKLKALQEKAEKEEQEKFAREQEAVSTQWPNIPYKKETTEFTEWTAKGKNPKESTDYLKWEAEQLKVLKQIAVNTQLTTKQQPPPTTRRETTINATIATQKINQPRK